MHTRTYFHTACALAPCLALAACTDGLFASSSDDSLDRDALVELPPLANAGPDREILRGYTASLDASGTWDPNGDSFDVAWEQVEGASVYLSNASSLTPTFVAPLTEQTLVFKLTVSDGTWSIIDWVTLLVRNGPSRVAPVFSAGPDYVTVDANDDPASRIFDGHAGIDEVVPVTEEIFPEVAEGSRHQAAYGGPHLFRVDSSRNGLASAADYVLVHAFAEAMRGEQAPTCNVDGPEQVRPGAAFTLDASDSADVNQDALMFFWEQTRGEPVMSAVVVSGDGRRELSLVAPSTPQELAFRVHAWDGRLASAPAEIRVLVAAEPGAEPAALAPGVDLVTRPGRAVDLVTRPATSLVVTQTADYEWEQTRGEPVTLVERESGRLVELVAPEKLGDLGFVVRARIGDVYGRPAAYRVTVVGPEVNSGPQVYVCASTLEPMPGQRVVVVVRADDPEGDPVEIGFPEQSPAEAGAITEIAMSDDGISDTCGSLTVSSASGETSARYFAFEAPLASGTVTLSIGACDHALCHTGSVDIVVP